jgi:hypothetical protein
MATQGQQKKYPQSFQQPYPAANRRHWINLNNLKTASTSLDQNYAQCNKLSASNGSYPYAETLDLLGFNFNIPEGAEITSIKVIYSYRLAPHVTGKQIKVAAPTVMLKNVAGQMGDTDVKGVTPVTEWRTRTITYDSTNYQMPSRGTVNKDSFGVEFRFPKNTSSNEGYIFINNVSIVVNYKTPTYTVDLVPSSDTGEYVQTVPFNLEAVCNNPDLMDYTPTVEITVPTGATLTLNGLTSDTFNQISETVYQWKPYTFKTGTVQETMTVYDASTGKNKTVTVNKKVNAGSTKLALSCTISTTGNKTITIQEKYTNNSKNVTVNVLGQATPIIPDTEVPSEKVVYAVQNSDFTLPVQIPVSMLGTTFYLVTDKALKIKTGDSYYSVSAGGVYEIPTRLFDETGYCELTAKTAVTGIVNIDITHNTLEVPETHSLIVKVVPEGYVAPRFTVLKLTDEEDDRMGDKKNYTVQADMRITCLAANIPYFVDYYRNFRLGVVNSIPATLNLSTIFNACRNWSDGITVFNQFENESVDFTYHHEYPVYIILTGNYDTTTCNYFEAEFGNLQCIESSRDDGDQVIFPVPIQDIISDSEEDIASLVIPANNNMNNLIFYKLGLSDIFKENTNLAIRGVEVRVHANIDENSILSASLKKPEGGSGERSVILYNTDSVHSIGGATDRWGFNISELKDLNDFELELSISNISGVANNVTIEKVEVIPYYIFYEKYKVDWFIEGENMAGFNVFLQDVNIPEGIKTSTKRLQIDGTDTNDAFRMNIREKEITVEFDIDECTIEESTATLQDVTELLVTERDRLYRPIAKRVEFSHYPGIYWNYIMEDPIEAEANGASYSCKAKLTVESGTAYTKDDITTGKAGRVAGLAKVNPIITCTPTSDDLEITEQFTGQKFTMSYKNWTTSDIVEIDSRNRKIYLHTDDETLDITNDAADWNTDWFLIQNDFLFNESGCVIQSVTWVERK